MNYKFPTIRHIDDVLPHLVGHDEFIVVDRGGWKAINYAVVTPESFWPLDEGAIMRRECRGLIFDALTGEILRRPFHKFFNFGERLDLLPQRRLEGGRALRRSGCRRETGEPRGDPREDRHGGDRRSVPGWASAQNQERVVSDSPQGQGIHRPREERLEGGPGKPR